MNINTIFEIINPWLRTSGLSILGILIIFWILHRFTSLVIERVIRKIIISDRFSSADAERKREDTLIRIFDGTTRILLWLVAIMMILSEFGLEIGPLIAGAGIIGLAFGFGGQYLIRDIISGLFIILENQYRVGDLVCLEGMCGTVEDITLRVTKLRDADGSVHYIPNGTISKTTNRSKDFSGITLEIGVSYDTDLDKLKTIINQVGQSLADDPIWKEKIILSPHFLRISNFGPSEVLVKIAGKTKPKLQFEVTGELRERLKKAFDKEGIEIPFPQVVMHQSK